MDTLTSVFFSGRMLTTLHVLSPTIVMTAYLGASMARVFGSKNSSPTHQTDGSGKKLRVACLVLTALIMMTYASESILLAFALPNHAATSSDDSLVFTLFSSLIWLILLSGLFDTSSPDIERVFSSVWILALLCDVALLVLDILTPKLSGSARICRLFWQAIRIVLLLGLIAIATGDRLKCRAEKADDEEIAPLLARIESHFSTSSAQHASGNAYGATTTDDFKKKADGKDSDQPKTDYEFEDSDDEDDDNAENGKFKKDWWVYTKAFRMFLPHLWPSKSVRLQLHLLVLGLCLLTSRLLNVLIPLQLGVIINQLRTGEGNVPWTAIGTFIVLQFLESSAGLSVLETWLWIPINRRTTEQLSFAAYDKVMNLSSDFHDSKKSGRMWRIVSRGESLGDLVYTLGFEIVPMAADLGIAVSVFWWLFDAYMAFIVATSSVLFLLGTAKTIPLKTRRQREYIDAWEDEYTQMTESSLNWTTVSYFNRVGYEQNRYRDKVRTSQDKVIRYKVVSFVTSALRSLTLRIGLLAAAMLAAYQISKGNRSVGDFVVLITYWGHLSGPLTYFAHGFSKIAKSLVDAEKLLELLETNPTVGNHEGAGEFVLKQGQVDFDRVCFSYDGKRQVADNLSFRAEPGQTVALVGETGGGKSTILKLLFRFYDASSGTVMIDGQDIRHVTLESLRANIGCVPQDPVLFNQTILQNLRYAKLDATEEEVQEACKAVALHDKILSFTKGYNEKVGERGVKLSGGELQRMAIARAILKDPKILLLDEATSSVDSETEAIIQASLKKLCAGRTTFVIAHRLSTIIHANLVMVIKNGRIIERGSHDKLMQVSGHYSRLWSRQLQLQTGEERSRSRSRSPEKTTVLVDDVTDSDIESRKGLLRKKKHENRGSEEGYGGSNSDGNAKPSTEPVMGAKVRGRSPRRNDKAWERFDSMRRKVLSSKSPRRKGENASAPQERRSQSHSPTRTTLQPQAPEFVPQSLNEDIPYLNRPDGTSQPGEDHPNFSPSQPPVEPSTSERTTPHKENLLNIPTNHPLTQSTPNLPEAKTTRFGFPLHPNNHKKNPTRSSNTSVMSSATESGIPEEESEQTLSEQQHRTDRKRKLKNGKPLFSSRRGVSKSEPRGRNQMDGGVEEVDGEEEGGGEGEGEAGLDDRAR